MKNPELATMLKHMEGCENDGTFVSKEWFEVECIVPVMRYW
jgi:hypothetical protein